jgi:hypothetical protein
MLTSTEVTEAFRQLTRLSTVEKFLFSAAMKGAVTAQKKEMMTAAKKGTATAAK